MEYNYYCDESCHLENDGKQYMVLGYVSVPTSRVKAFKKELKGLRIKHKNTLEIKWSNLNDWNFGFYSDVIDFFFDRTELNFRGLIVDKNRYIAAKCDNDYDMFYYKMYYQLIYHMLNTDYHVYNIYVDIKDDLSSYRIHKLQNILNSKMEVIRKIQHLRSHEVIFIQMCDLIIGAMSYKMNVTNKSSIPKLRLIDKIEKRCGCNISCQTLKSASKFNIFKINI